VLFLLLVVVLHVSYRRRSNRDYGRLANDGAQTTGAMLLIVSDVYKTTHIASLSDGGDNFVSIKAVLFP